MDSRSLEEKIAYLMDRAEIDDLIGRYAYGIDSRDWELYASIWTDELTLDFTAATEGHDSIIKMTRDHWVASLQKFFEEMPASQHLKLPLRYDFDGDTCTVLSLLRAKHYMPNHTGGPVHAVMGYYLDHFVRTPVGWRMTGFKEIPYWNEGNAHVMDHNLNRMLPVFAGEWNPEQ